MLATSLVETGHQLAEQMGIDWAKFTAQTINFLLVLGVLWYFAYRPVLRMLADRKRLIQEGLADAERGRQSLAQAEEERRKILREAEARSERMVAEARAAADVQGAKRLAAAQTQAETLVQQARETMTRDRAKLEVEMRQELVRLVVLTTGKVVGRVLTPQDEERLRQEAVAQIAG
ncbi:MAG: F0F1 ATP synthase subunit B [Verrucomicrobia bacterium]|nr:F0F1 ATP synthase subunit B [Verrucomicrobiota bacterium]